MSRPYGIRMVGALFWCGFAVLACLAAVRYPGQIHVYGVFTVLAAALLHNGFSQRALFFDTFMGLLLWLGFWLKVSVRVAFAQGVFSEPVGRFDGTGHAFDQVLWVASCGFSAVLIAGAIRQRWFSYPSEGSPCGPEGLYRFYCRHRRLVLILFLLGVLGVAVTNAWWGVYQRGMVPQTVLPYGLGGIYKWLLQFGWVSGVALIVRFEMERSRGLNGTAVMVPLLEGFLSNASLLSRGMILNAAAVTLGAYRLLRASAWTVGRRQVVVAGLWFMLLFGVSVVSVNYLRTWSVVSAHVAAQAQAEPAIGRAPDVASTARTEPVSEDRLKRVVQHAVGGMLMPLFVDRWVGVEGVMAVVSSGQTGWDIWRRAWDERFQLGVLSLYDQTFIESPYKDSPMGHSQHHFVSLPGIVAFLYYPGSLPFLFGSLLLCCLAGAGLERVAYVLCGRNLVLCSVFAQVLAFRLASFGYVPAQTYLMVGALFGNIVLIFLTNRVVVWWQARSGYVA